MPATDLATESSVLADRVAGIVREAGQLAFGKFRTAVKSWTKGQSSPVCEADIAVDEFLRDRLTAVAPEAGWLSEESIDDPARLSARRVWIVDPIDGTRAFLAHRADWAVSVALVDNGRPLVAALFAPVNDAMYFAARGEGATLNGSRLAANAGADFTGVLVAGPKRAIEALRAVAPSLEPAPKVFSLALRLARVAEGTLDIAFAGARAHDWDLAAADLLVHEAGGAMTTLDGQVLAYNGPETVHGMLVAASAGRHKAILDLARAHRLSFT